MIYRTLPRLLMLTVAVIAMTDSGFAASPSVHRHGIFEASLTGTRDYANPSADVEVAVQLTAPSGVISTVNAFWDGGRTWKARFSPNEIGRWGWRSECSDKGNKGLDDRIGAFDCIPYNGKNPLYAHGPLKLSPNRRYLTHSDGRPFFWLADTAWNGVLKAKPSDWENYLSTRQAQGFTAVQFVSAQWRSYVDGLAYTGKTDIKINPDFFQRLDPMVKAINDHGMVASPVIMWAVGKGDPGHELSEEDAIRLGKYMVARWGAHNVCWILAGDGVYLGKRAERWQRIGRAVFGDKPNRPATMHPLGSQWIAEEFGGEPWYSMIGYQSAHSETKVEWLVQGPPAKDWKRTPTLPVINLEPCYEGIMARDTGRPINALTVRRALYRSLLVSPTAGVTYGHHGIWWWGEKPELPLTQEKTGIAVPWDQALKSEGAESVEHLWKLFASIKWWTLVPDPTLVSNQPADAMSFFPSARNDNGNLAVIYLPEGGEVELMTKNLRRTTVVRWFNPSTGEFTPAGRISAAPMKLRAPGGGDWVLLIGR